MVITELSRSANRRSLYPLLFVSRQFYQLITPFLYESITLPKASFRTFINNGAGQTSRAGWVSVQQAFAHFSRLKRLHIIPPIPLDSHLILALPPSISLTHLVFQNTWTDDVYALICSQPSLEYIRIGHAEQSVPTSTLPPVVLPNLTSLSCGGCFFNKLEGSPPIKDLYLVFPSIYGQTAFEILRNVRYLSLPYEVFERVAEYCESVEFLYINSPSDVDDANNRTLTKMPSRALKYFRFEPYPLCFKPVKHSWDEFPNIAVIDTNTYQDTTWRVFHGNSKQDGIGIHIPKPEEFERWHEICMDGSKARSLREDDLNHSYRQFHALIIPLLYESITLPSLMMEYRVHTFGPETTIPTPAHFSKFVTTICHNPALAAHIVSFINDDTSDSSLIDWVLLVRAVTQLTHLKKLYISNMVAAENMSLLPPSASLTHLFLGGLLSSTAYKFVCSQLSLQYVNLGPASEEGALDELPSIALPNLVTLECHEDFFAKLDGSSPPPMENLCIRSVRTAPPVEGMQSRVVRNVRTLSLSCRTFKKNVSWCERVEFLSITSESVDIDTILLIPSPALKYLRTANFILSLEDVDRLFAAFPNLRVVDIEFHYLDMRRFTRGSSEYRKVYVPSEERFEHWHERCVDHV
ncbi:hypothetical protein ONZ45_g16343 [Pleurotus djamor]|nr:hypothetical protein ONZ45_g16343 [Pleurotus djamor]